MLKVDVYPVLEGVEVWVTSICGRVDGEHVQHGRGRAALYVGADELSRHGEADAVMAGLVGILREYPGLIGQMRC